MAVCWPDPLTGAVLRRARPEDLQDMSTLCLRSKAHWGYDDRFMAACRVELTLTPQDVQNSALAVLEDKAALIGVVQVARHGGETHLEKLFVDPDHMGRGHGTRMMHWAVQQARAAGADAMLIEADPDAAAFYERYGAHHIGSAPSGSVKGRRLPLLRLPLSGVNAP